MSWFPRFNPSGTRLTAEGPDKWQAQWLTDTDEIWHDGTHLVINGTVQTALAGNDVAAGGGRWAVLRAENPPVINRSWDTPIVGGGTPALSSRGHFAYTHPRQAPDKHLWVEGKDQPLDFGAIADVRISNEAIVWTKAGQTWGARIPEFGRQLIQVAPSEFRPIPIDTPDGPWVLCHTHTGILLRPFGETHGYRFDNGGQTYYPDGVYVAGIIRVAFTDKHGALTTKPFHLSDPRVDLRATPKPDPDPDPEPDPVPTPTPADLGAFGRRFMALVASTNAADYRSVLARIQPDLWPFGVGVQMRSSGEPNSRLQLPHADCRNVAPRPGNAGDLFLGVRQDTPEAWKSTVDTVWPPNAPTQWILHGRLGPAYVPLDVVVEPPPPDDDDKPPPPPPVDLGPILARLTALEERAIFSGASITLKLGETGRYVCADANYSEANPDNNPDTKERPLYANRDGAGSWETFIVQVKR